MTKALSDVRFWEKSLPAVDQLYLQNLSQNLRGWLYPRVSYDELVMTARWALTYCSFWRLGRLRGSRKFKISKTDQQADRNASVHRFTQQLKQSATHADLLAQAHPIRSTNGRVIPGVPKVGASLSDNFFAKLTGINPAGSQSDDQVAYMYETLPMSSR
jgi:hypothetical protein